MGRFFPSSKLCRHCGEKNSDLKLQDRSWRCKSCGQELERDHNAAINILNRSLKIKEEELLKNSGAVCGSESKQKHGEALAAGAQQSMTVVHRRGLENHEMP